MFEDVRLVIWDLDETFWGGTLTEGGMRRNPAHEEVVRELSRRGIVNAICSRNDRAEVERVLADQGMWDWFVFPSIDWTAKAGRVAAIVAAAQLRPASVLFLDDSAANRAEAKALLPELQVADAAAVAGLLDSPGLRGRPDPGLERLGRYKLLEARHGALGRAGDDPRGFLRESGIVVEIIHDVAAHLDRAVELLSRTNQLNFTKRRLAEDPAEAGRQLRAEMAPFHARAGLVAVRDRHGDHGLCGFFLVEGIEAWGRPVVRHFAFSCRVMGMGVEQYVYRLLGEPRLQVVGEVVSDLAWPVDWINTRPAAPALLPGGPPPPRLGPVRIRGGCELEVIGHFFRAAATSVSSELLARRGILYHATNSSGLLAQVARGLTPPQRAKAEELGMDAPFFATGLFDPCPDDALTVFCPTADGTIGLRHHRASGLRVPVWFHDLAVPEFAPRTEADRLEYERVAALVAREFRTVRYYDWLGALADYRAIVRRLPTNALTVVALPNALWVRKGRLRWVGSQRRLNRAFRLAARGRRNIRFVEMSELLAGPAEVDPAMHFHFDRAVYHRLYLRVLDCWRDWLEERAQ